MQTGWPSIGSQCVPFTPLPFVCADWSNLSNLYRCSSSCVRVSKYLCKWRPVRILTQYLLKPTPLHTSVYDSIVGGAPTVMLSFRFSKVSRMAFRCAATNVQGHAVRAKPSPASSLAERFSVNPPSMTAALCQSCLACLIQSILRGNTYC